VRRKRAGAGAVSNSDTAGSRDCARMSVPTGKFKDRGMSEQGKSARPGYLVVQGVVTDRDGFKAYSAALPPIYAKYGGRYLAMVPAPLVEVAEGDAEQRSVVIARFASKEAAWEFWNSPEYAEAKKLREGKGSFYVMVLEGMPDS
jgi:uncharacterized protein (DUF1330 family)